MLQPSAAFNLPISAASRTKAYKYIVRDCLDVPHVLSRDYKVGEVQG